MIKKVIISGIAVISICCAIFYFGEQRRANSLINPDIHPAFKRIENYALVYVEQQIVDRLEYERCKEVVKHLGQQWDGWSTYPNYEEESAEDYYEYLSGLRFTLPPFRLSSPPTQEQYDKAMREKDELTTLQLVIIMKQLDDLDQEVMRTLDSLSQ